VVNDNQFKVLDLPTLEWPTSLGAPTNRFRLFVAADTLNSSVEEISRFALAALKAGMVYCCTWGRGCERFHDIVDECISEDDIGARKFAGANKNDVVMTTWHENESLQEALDFFTTCAMPADGFADDSGFRVVICVGHSEWAVAANDWLAATTFFI
jgi:hypothetical protein